MIPAFVLLVFGCATSPEQARGPIPARAEVVRAELREWTAGGEAARALERIDALRFDSVVSGAELQRRYGQAVTALRDQYREARGAGRYADAERHLRSLHAAARQSDAAVGRSESAAAPSFFEINTEPPDFDPLYLSWALAEEETGNEVSALYRLMQMQDLGGPEPDLLRRFADHAASLNDDAALRRIVEELESRGVDVSEETRRRMDTDRTPREAMPGTATIWVNRGIRMEQGTGVPDRVIGSGFFIDPRGYLITNYHVVRSEVDPEYEGYSRLFVRLPGDDDSRIPARVVGYDRIFDVALLKVEITPDYIFSVTDIRALDPGSEVRAIGSPGGLDNSITSGIISATGRRFLQLGDALQIDVPVNPGSSGGPLLNTDGQLVGVVFAGVQQFQGVNFAIPSFWLQRLVPRLYEEGELSHVWLGVSLREASDGLAVNYVAPQSPADRMGLSRDDVIRAVDGREVSTIAGAQEALLGHRPGTLVAVELRSGEDEQIRLARVDERPFSPIEHALEYQQEDEVFAPLFGMEINNIGTFPWQRRYVVTDVYPGSVADETGLSPQDPFSLQRWQVDYDRRIALAQIIIRKRKAGFLESGVQLTSYLEQDNFL